MNDRSWIRSTPAARRCGALLASLPILGVIGAGFGVPTAHADNHRFNSSVVSNVYTIQRHAGCTDDLRVSPPLQLAAQWQGRPNVPGIALIDVSPAARSPENAAVQPPALKGRVLSERQWFIITPTVVAIEEGKVVAVNDTDEDAAQWVARVFPGH